MHYGELENREFDEIGSYLSACCASTLELNGA